MGCAVGPLCDYPKCQGCFYCRDEKCNYFKIGVNMIEHQPVFIFIEQNEEKSK